MTSATAAPALTTLETTGLINQAQMEPELEYIFRHALVQEAAYASLLKADRKALHRAVGETLERLYPDRLNELAARLGQHFVEAGDSARALHYFSLAGDVSARVYANIEAVQHYSAALELARPTSPVAALTSLYLRRGRALELTGRYDEALASYADMEALAQARGDQTLELAARMELTKLRAVPSLLYDPPQGRVLAAGTIALARALHDQAAEARALWLLLILNLYSGNDLGEALQYGEQALALARQLNLTELQAFILNDIWYAYLGLGRLSQARAALDEAGPLWRSLGNLPMQAANESFQSNIDLWEGALAESIAGSQEGFRLAGSAGNLEGQATSRFFVGLALTESGLYAEAFSVVEEGLALGERFGLLALLSGSRAELGWSYTQVGAPEHGLQLARQADAVAEARIPPLRGWTQQVLARLYLLRGDLPAATAILDSLSDFREARGKFGFIPCYWIGLGLARAELALARADYPQARALAVDLYHELNAFSVRLYRADVQYLLGQTWLAEGRLDEAQAAFTQACADAEAINSRRMLWPSLGRLSEVEARRGRTAEAQALRAQARPVVTFITEHCPAELRAGFLALPAVQALMA